MKWFFIGFIISVFLVSVWIFISLHLPDPESDKPSLFIYKTRYNGEKLAYVAFRANKKSPLRLVLCPYKGTKKEKYQFALMFMYTRRFMDTFDGSKEEWELMYDTIEKELSNK